MADSQHRPTVILQVDVFPSEPVSPELPDPPTPVKVLRFRMPYFHGNSEDRTASRWHLPAKNYNPKEARGGGYRELVALCGYSLPRNKAWDAQWTTAKSVPKKDQCMKCAAKKEGTDDPVHE